MGEQSSDSQGGGSPAEGGFCAAFIIFFLIDATQGDKRKKICFENSVDCSQKIHVTENFALDFYLPRNFLQGVTSWFLCDAQNLILTR